MRQERDGHCMPVGEIGWRVRENATDQPYCSSFRPKFILSAELIALPCQP